MLFVVPKCGEEPKDSMKNWLASLEGRYEINADDNGVSIDGDLYLPGDIINTNKYDPDSPLSILR